MDDPGYLSAELADLEQPIDIGSVEESDDDGLGSYADTEFIDEIYTHGDYLEDIGTPPSNTGRDEFKIRHSSGNFKMKLEHFLSSTDSADFNASQALEMLQRRYTLDFGRKSSGSKSADPEDKYFPVFHLDMVSIIGRPLQPITTRSGFFDNITFTLGYWNSPYGKHVTNNLPFDIRNKTFRIATAASREHWFIVMHPVHALADDLTGSRSQRHQKQNASRRGSAVQRHHAESLASYLISIFSDGELLGEGIEPSWSLNDRRSSSLSYDKWAIFQQLFMEGWQDFALEHAYDSFWVENEPAFHTYDCGANIAIEVTEQLAMLPVETSLRPRDEEEDTDSDSSTEDEDDAGENAARPTPRQGVANSNMQQGSTGNSTDDHADDGYNRHLYSGGLEQLRSALESKYDLQNIEQISYALAADIHCEECTDHGATQEEENNHDLRSTSTLCLLADRRKLTHSYGGSGDFIFYPLAFHPRFGNFSCRRPPQFLGDVCTVMQDNASYQNSGAEDVLSFGYFHAYSNIKRTIRNRIGDLLPARGIATGALTLPPTEAKQRAPIRARQQRLLRSLCGEQTPGQPELSTPFARERHRIKAAMSQEQLAFRMEQVVTIRTSRLDRSRRHFYSVLQPIFQLMRFFLKEKRAYTAVLRGFQPAVFPNILCSFARVFELALGEMHRRFEARGDAGLDLAHCEATAVLDRLGNYCFTGDHRVLMSTVLGPLDTMNSLKLGAWPYISPDLLDFREPRGRMNGTRWPRTQGKERKPILLHLASLEFHYGRVIAANCHSRAWFGQLGAEAIIGHGGSVSRFLGKIFRDLWVPEMVSFMVHQLRSRLNQGARGRREAAEYLGQSQLFSAALETWEAYDEPFSIRNFEKLFRHDDVAASLVPTITHRTNKARHDFAVEVYEACLEGNESAGQAICSRNATWLSVLREAIRTTSKDQVSPQDWIRGITKGMSDAGIECLPGCHRQRLTSRRIIRLEGDVRDARVVKLAITGPPGSLKRAAMEAEQRMMMMEHLPKRVRRRRIDFGCDIPFTRVPKVIQEGFDKLQKSHEKGDQGVVRHLELAHGCLVQCLGDPLCDLMLMLALTFAACTVTPHLEEVDGEFQPAAKKRDAEMLAATMVTRMLWFLRPEDFPIEENSRGILTIGKMTQKIEHRGFNNRSLLKLGWIIAPNSRRLTPRTSESRLRADDELYEERKRLLSAMKDADRFISLVFRSDDKLWVDRCSSIIRDR